MSELAPATLQPRLLRILHRAFVQARNLALRGDCRQLSELADTFEALPELMTHWDETTLARVRCILAEYQTGHPQSGYEYLSLLDGEETAFLEADGFNGGAGREPKGGREGIASP